MTASEILDRAKELVTGPRAASYGSFRENAEYAARVAGVTPKQAALVMIGFKLSREMHQHSQDNIDDLVGYGALLGEVAEEANLTYAVFEGLHIGKDTFNKPPYVGKFKVTKAGKKGVEVSNVTEQGRDKLNVDFSGALDTINKQLATVGKKRKRKC
jgi:hypothetical protein